MPFYFDPKKFRLGMRTVKTGLSVFIVLLLYKFIDWEAFKLRPYQQFLVCVRILVKAFILARPGFLGMRLEAVMPCYSLF